MKPFGKSFPASASCWEMVGNFLNWDAGTGGGLARCIKEADVDANEAARKRTRDNRMLNE